LRSAAILLSKLPRDSDKWDFAMFPGALWDKSSARLVLPLPAWGTLNDLAAISPLLNVIERQKGFVSKLDILPVPNQTPVGASERQVIDRLKLAVANVVGIPKFADAGQIGTATDILFPAGG
jgi:hypothetical protein